MYSANVRLLHWHGITEVASLNQVSLQISPEGSVKCFICTHPGKEIKLRLLFIQTITLQGLSIDFHAEGDTLNATFYLYCSNHRQVQDQNSSDSGSTFHSTSAFLFLKFFRKLIGPAVLSLRGFIIHQ